MPSLNDPEFVEALERLFITRSELRQILDYQQKLFSSLQELGSSHRQVHEHVRRLTDSHNRVQGDTTELIRARNDVLRALNTLEDAHRQTQGEVRRAIDTINYMQQAVRDMPRLDERLAKLEREVQRLWQEDKNDGRKDDEHDQRLRKLEQRR